MPDYMLQSSPLTPGELTAAYKTLLAAKRAGRAFLAFFNCGEPSGSSQGHKHLQFLPLPNPEGPPVEKLARRQQLEAQGYYLALPLCAKPELTKLIHR